MYFSLIEIFEIFSSISFMVYGYLSFYSERMKNEFFRWGISKFRVIVGISQFAGGIGLLIGFSIPFFTLISSIGLTTLMLIGFILRIYVKDGLIKSLPALFYLIINLLIFKDSYYIIS